MSRAGSLDGLRGLAAVGVVTCHLSSLPLGTYVTGGNIGVLVFFVLSGYLVAGQCWDRVASTSALRTFLRRRVQRLAPAIAGVTLLGGALVVAFGGQPVADALRYAAAALTQTMAFAYVAGLPPHPAWSPLWSLSVEWTFYLLVPFIALAAHRRGLRLQTARNGSVVLAALLYLTGWLLPPEAAYLLPAANLGVMFAGASLALTHRLSSTRRRIDPAWSLTGGVVLLLLFVLPQHPDGSAYLGTVLPATVLSTIFIIDGCRHGSRVGRWLDTSWLRSVGLRAYSIYLWHLPVLWVAATRIGRASPWLVLAVFALALPAVVSLSFRYLEVPTLNAGRTRGTAARARRRTRTQDAVPETS